VTNIKFSPIMIRFSALFNRLKLAASLAIGASIVLSACQPQIASFPSGASDVDLGSEAGSLSNPASADLLPTPLPTRPIYAPGELVDYIAQTGDTLPNLAARFNTTVKEILEANPFIPPSATTMPPGMPMKIPIYYLPLWGSSYRIIPDSRFINGPAMLAFNSSQFVSQQPGWLNGYVEYAAGSNRTGAEIVDYVAMKYSVSPTLLLALLDYQSGALTNPEPDSDAQTYPMGYHSAARKGLYRQLIWSANALNNGYYGFRTSHLLSIEYPDGRLERFDPWINAATAALHYFFNLLLPIDQYPVAIGPEGLAKTYQDLFGDPWLDEQPHLPGSLEQPAFNLPFLPGAAWAFTGGPHTGYGSGEPFAALDFAPPSDSPGCIPTSQWATAVAPGVIARSAFGEVILDLDGDGDERTGWTVFYMHTATEGRAAIGTQLNTGDPVGHPSCEGGTSTGTHIHIARKYNGEWILAEGVLAFNLEGWIAHNGSQAYLGTLTRGSSTVTACVCSNAATFIEAGKP
jgi:LysM repeat protein